MPGSAWYGGWGGAPPGGVHDRESLATRHSDARPASEPSSDPPGGVGVNIWPPAPRVAGDANCGVARRCASPGCAFIHRTIASSARLCGACSNKNSRVVRCSRPHSAGWGSAQATV